MRTHIHVFSHTRSGFLLFLPMYQPVRKKKTKQLHIDLWGHCYVIITSPCRISVYSGFSGSLFHVFPIKKEVLRGEQEKESIICVRVGSKNPSLVITICHNSGCHSVILKTDFQPHPHTHDGSL